MAKKMMHESIQQFFQMASQDQELQEKLKAAPNHEAYINLVVEQGNEKGYSFTSDQVVSALNTATSAEKGKDAYSGELDESELEAVAGGFDIFEDVADMGSEVIEGGEDVTSEVLNELPLGDPMLDQDNQQDLQNTDLPGDGPQPGEPGSEENEENIVPAPPTP